MSLGAAVSRGANWMVLLFAFGSSACCATDVVLAGVFPGKALVVVNGGAPRALNVGSVSGEGIRVISVDGDRAVLEFDGRRRQFVVGEHAVSLSGSGSGLPQVRLSSDSRGMFRAQGSINGLPVQFLVDTGASVVALGKADALRAGISPGRGEPMMVSTANGAVMARRVVFDVVQVGGIALHNVAGVVMAEDMPDALLGMSFLTRMEMQREGASLLLRQRY